MGYARNREAAIHANRSRSFEILEFMGRANHGGMIGARHPPFEVI